MEIKKINSALISVFYKDGIEDIAAALASQGATILSTGGTYDYLTERGFKVEKVEDLTLYPSILGGRVKTLHPKVFGGILARRDNPSDREQMNEYQIPYIDLVIVDLYPFEEYVAKGAAHQDIIEKIDIGGISLIRAAAKNYKDVVIVSDKSQYSALAETIRTQGGCTLEQRYRYAADAFRASSGYDRAINEYLAGIEHLTLRYGENPHQKAEYVGAAGSLPQQLHGKEISYNNMLDIEAAVELISDFQEKPTVAVIKHNNACGCAVRETLLQAWTDALAGDPVSAFGGIIITNRKVDATTAAEIGKIFFEVILAPAYDDDALEILKQKKNRIILVSGNVRPTEKKFRSMLQGRLEQDRDAVAESPEDLTPTTTLIPTAEQVEDLLFANRIVKHSKSNAIVLAKGGMLLASGIGQTSRVDALKQAIAKAGSFGFDLNGAVMASDAFFPFPDCVQIAHEAGIDAVIHPGGSIRDQESIDYCNANNVAMVITGKRHFKH